MSSADDGILSIFFVLRGSHFLQILYNSRPAQLRPPLGKWKNQPARRGHCVDFKAIRCSEISNDDIIRVNLKMKTFVAKPETVQRDWYVVDATDKTLGRLASEIALRASW